MENVMKKVGKASSFLTKYIGIIIICFSMIAFFWRDGFAWTTNYTSIFLGVAMFGMGLTIKMNDFKRVFSRPKEIVIGILISFSVSLRSKSSCHLLQSYVPHTVRLRITVSGVSPSSV